MNDYELALDQLRVARDLCRTMLKHQPTRGSVLAVSQEIEQVLMYLEHFEKSYSFTKKIERI